MRIISKYVTIEQNLPFKSDFVGLLGGSFTADVVDSEKWSKYKILIQEYAPNTRYWWWYKKWLKYKILMMIQENDWNIRYWWWYKKNNKKQDCLSRVVMAKRHR